MALRNYLYAKHDNNTGISNKIAGRSEQNSAIKATIREAKLNADDVKSDCKRKKNGQCQRCPTCSKSTITSLDDAKTSVELDDKRSITSEIDFTKIDF